MINLSETPSNYDQEKKIPNIVQKFHIYGNVNKYSLLYIVLGLIFQYIIVEQIGQATTERGRFDELVPRTFPIFIGNRSSDSIWGNGN